MSAPPTETMYMHRGCLSALADDGKQNEPQMALQLLKRPRPLPSFKDEEKGIHAQWKIKGYYYKKDGLPKISIRGQARVQYAQLVIEGKLPNTVTKKALVNIGYIENSGDILDIRGCNYRLLIFGVDHVEVKPVKDDQQLRISKLHPFNCFKFW
ncbi:unnamed protein product [Caenorhabditis auriculariae]|uniref:Uncharacterized protein n=1 Tax=Caenorhabditis auriculariae TaxID=2777116 RepID=A0A8S1GW88_9PELO|nr:unnamed protein product [Caenorhabditis auriculariae]